MGWWSEQALPRVVDVSCGPRVTATEREQACAGLSGVVVELGFGSGTNLPFYPEEVRRVVAIEPSDTAWHLAARRIAKRDLEVVRGGRDAARLSLPDASADAVLSTWSLCTIPDVEAALREVCRVLRPGGRLHFVEHGLSPDEPVARWQHRLDPWQGRLFGGCHLTRPIADLVTGARLELVDLRTSYATSFPPLRPFSWFLRGHAQAP